MAVPAFFDDSAALFDDPLFTFDGELSTAGPRPRHAAAKVVEASDLGVLLQTLKQADEVWVFERHEDEYAEIAAIDPAELVEVTEAEKFVENSHDFNYALFQTVRETAFGFESNADELTIYRGNYVKKSVPEKAPAIFLGWMVEVAPEDYQLTVIESEATHGLIDTTGEGDLEIVPIAELDGSVKVRRIGEDTYRIY